MLHLGESILLPTRRNGISGAFSTSFIHSVMSVNDCRSVTAQSHAAVSDHSDGLPRCTPSAGGGPPNAETATSTAAPAASGGPSKTKMMPAHPEQSLAVVARCRIEPGASHHVMRTLCRFFSTIVSCAQSINKTHEQRAGYGACG